MKPNVVGVFILFAVILLLVSCQSSDSDLKEAVADQVNEILEDQGSNYEVDAEDLAVDQVKSEKDSHKARFVLEVKGKRVRESIEFESANGKFEFDDGDIQDFALEILEARTGESSDSVQGLKVYKLRRSESFTLYNENPDLDERARSKVYDGGLSASMTILVEREDTPGILKILMFQRVEDERNLLAGTMGNTYGIVGFIRAEFLNRFDFLGYYKEDQEANAEKMKEQAEWQAEQQRLEHQRILETKRATAKRIDEMIKQQREAERSGQIAVYDDELEDIQERIDAASSIKVTRYSHEVQDGNCVLVLELENKNDFAIKSVELHLRIRDSRGRLWFEEESVKRDVSLGSGESTSVRVIIGSRDVCERMVGANVLYQVTRAEL